MKRGGEKILSQAIAALYEDPYASMDEIAERIGVARSTIYRHFETRDKLIIAASEQSHERFMELMLPILDEPILAREKFIKFLSQYIPISVDIRFLNHNTAFRNNPIVIENNKKKDSILRSLIVDMKKEGSINEKISEDWLLIVFMHIMYASLETVANGNAGKNTVHENVDYLLFNKIFLNKN